MEQDKNTDITNVLDDLTYRIDITKRSRIKASSRLRLKHERFEKVIHFYSILILILTVWFLAEDETNTYFITKFLLVLSLTVTFLSMYLNMKNYKERAGSFETNYQNLDVLLNKINRKMMGLDKLDIHNLKEYQREYERLIIDKENHLPEDYQKALHDYNKSQERKKSKKSDIEEKNENKDKDIGNKKNRKKRTKDELNEHVKYFILFTFPIWIAILLYLLELIISKFF